MADSTKPEQCGNPQCNSNSTKVQRCGRCLKTAYCSRECQTACWPWHKTTCWRQNYVIKFHLAPEHITNPPVIRTLSIPADTAFYGLHLALQTAFGWATTHSFDFAVLDPDYENSGDITDFLKRLQQRQANGGVDASAPREYLLRITDPVERTMFSGVDRMHERHREHPNTIEKKADKFRLYQLFDDPTYRGEQALCPGLSSLGSAETPIHPLWALIIEWPCAKY
jgi:Plasmid pRiA4b ORF-3-like protein/MYND finger